MTISDKDIEQIERYLLSKASNAEKEEVEKRMQQDKDFAEQVTFMREAITASKQEGRKEFKNKINDIGKKVVDKLENEADEEMNKSASSGKILRLNKRKWLYYAASIAAAIIIGVFIITPLNPGMKLFNEYYKPYSNEIVPYTRGEQVPTDFSHFTQEQYNLIVRAMKHYERGNYKEAVALFEDNVERNKENAGLILYMGICQLETGKEKKAIENFKYILNLSNPPLKEQAQWYLALSYLKTKQSDKAKELFEKILDNKNHQFHDQALEIAKALNINNHSR